MSKRGHAPAMPVPEVSSDDGRMMPPQYWGLTKRELFAAMAMQGLLANRAALEGHTQIAACNGPGVSSESVTAHFAAVAADALLAALGDDDE